MSVPSMKDRDLACTPGARKPGDLKVYLHSLIGIGIMVLFHLLPPFGGITPIGMKMVGAFLGMIYLWSLVDTLWSSLLGIIVMGLSGFSGEGLLGMKATLLNAFGQDVVLLVVFAMVLFGAIYEVGCANYIVKWFLTRRIIKGHPYVFISIFYMAIYVLSALMGPVTALLVVWPISLVIMEELEIEQCDAFWPLFFVGSFFATTVAQPLLPFHGAQLVVISAFEKMTQTTINYGAYMSVNFSLAMLLIFTYIFALKFIIRPDTSKLKNVDPDKIEKSQNLPPMNLQQKAFLYLIPVYMVLLLIPGFLPKTWPGVSLLHALGPCGITIIFVVLFCVWRYEGKPMLSFKEVAYNQFNWGIFFMIAAAVFGANALSADSTGVKVFLLNALNPVLGGRSEFGFVAIMFTVALIITNFANNAAMAVVLMPVILAFSGQMGLNPTPIAMGVGMMVFVAMLTPAASPHAGMMHGRRDIYATKDIMRIGFPCCIISLIYYIVVGYPLAKIIFGS